MNAHNVAAILDYSDPTFLVRARKLISARHPFFVEIRGEALEALKPRMVGETLPGWAGLVVVPKLQPLVGVLTGADAFGLATSFEVREDMVGLWVGIGRA